LSSSRQAQNNAATGKDPFYVDFSDEDTGVRKQLKLTLNPEDGGWNLRVMRYDMPEESRGIWNDDIAYDPRISISPYDALSEMLPFVRNAEHAAALHAYLGIPEPKERPALNAYQRLGNAA